MGNGALHSGDLRFNHGEATGQPFAEGDAVLEEDQDFGAGKVGYITGAAGLAGFLQNAILILAEAKVDDAVADFGRHRIQVSFMRRVRQYSSPRPDHFTSRLSGVVTRVAYYRYHTAYEQQTRRVSPILFLTYLENVLLLRTCGAETACIEFEWNSQAAGSRL